MIRHLVLERTSGDGQYEDVMDVSEYLGRGLYGSAPNALVTMVRQSKLFQRTVKKMAKNNGESERPKSHK